MSANPAKAAGPPSTLEESRLRQERDRFLAFAFCRNDLLIELDAAQVVHFIGGPTEALLGTPPEELKGTQGTDLFTPDSRPLVEQLLKAADLGERITQATVTMIGADGAAPPTFEINGYKFGDLEGHYFFALRSNGQDREDQ